MERVYLDRFISGGQVIGTLASGKKILVWGGLPGEAADVEITEERARYAVGIAQQIIEPSKERVPPRDPDSYLATSPWQILNSDAEQNYKTTLIDEAFAFQKLALPKSSQIYSDGRDYLYRNKFEFKWAETTISSVPTLDIAYSARDSHDKLPLNSSALPQQQIMSIARQIRDLLRANKASATLLDSLVVRADQTGAIVWQLRVKSSKSPLSQQQINALPAQGGQVVFWDTRHSSSKTLLKAGDLVLRDQLLGKQFSYTIDGFFQVNPPIYEQSLRDIEQYVNPTQPLLDLYSGVGSIGLAVGGDKTTLVEINKSAVHTMKQNVAALDSNARVVLAASEKALDYITPEQTVIVDPPRAGLDKRLITRLLEVNPPRIIYLSCNPVTQARDVKYLAKQYDIIANHGYNFFPHTPHIEHLVILEKH